jgi:hypothetical protein
LPGREALITVSSGGDWSALSQHLKEHGITPTHVFPPWCAIVEVSPAVLDDLRGLSGARVVVDALPESELASLPEEFRFVASAWNESLRSKKRVTVRGEGLSWDAPGFLPPDPPASVREYLRAREREVAQQQSSGEETGESDKTKKR